MTALAALTLTTRQRFGQRIEVELGIGPRSRRAADIDNQIDSSLWRQLDEPGRCSASNVPPYRREAVPPASCQCALHRVAQRGKHVRVEPRIPRGPVPDAPRRMRQRENGGQVIPKAHYPLGHPARP